MVESGLNKLLDIFNLHSSSSQFYLSVKNNNEKNMRSLFCLPYGILSQRKQKDNRQRKVY